MASSSMSVERLVANLVRVAREDLDGARVLARANNRNAIYLCEQAAEKLIRAVVSFEGPTGRDGRPRTGRESAQADPARYRIPGRIRDDVPLSHRGGTIKAAPAPEDLERAITRVASALDAVVEAFDIDLAQRDAPAAKSGPLR